MNQPFNITTCALVILISGLLQSASASNLSISKPILYNHDNSAYAVFNVAWENAWSNSKNNDAVWLFFKSISPNQGYEHIKVAQEGHSIVTVFSEDLALNFDVPEDGVGLFLRPSGSYSGDIQATIRVEFARGSFKNVDPQRWDFRAYGIEMVHIPEGAHSLGDPDTTAMAFGSFYAPDDNGGFGALVEIESEEQSLQVGEQGDLYYRSGVERYEGDQTGIIPSTYPKGVSPFHIMKYEPTEGNYVSFLNSLNQDQATDRVIYNEEHYQEQGGTIRYFNGQYRTTYPNKPCMFLSWDDGMAFADWSGLRPMTEFEFSKAARGPTEPLAGGFPWGSNEREKIQRLPDSVRCLTLVNGWDESHMSEENRAYFGASYYWVFDLSGSLWERVITIGHPIGRAYTGTHGDGLLSENGYATVENWPKGFDSAGGIGFRGGGFYGYDREYHVFNPFSPIAYRRYGGWHGPMRNNAYGTRFVRSAE
jgi:hypothetical protein